MPAPPNTTTVSRALFWTAVAVVGIAFFTANADSALISTDDVWGPEVAQQIGLGQAGRVASRGLAYLLLASFGGWALISKAGPRLSLRGRMPVLMICFVGWSLLSVAWSEEPWTSTMRWIQLACGFVAALGLGRRFSARDLCLLALIVVTVYVVLGVCTEVAVGAFQPWSADYRFTGEEHPNTQAQYCVIICLAAVAMLHDAQWPRRRSVLLLSFGVPLLILTGSRTSCGGVLVALLIYWSLRLGARTRLCLGLALGWTACLAGLLSSLAAPDTKQGFAGIVALGRPEEVGSLTGRVPLWVELVQYIQTRPLTGFGYGGFWTLERKEDLWSRLNWVAGSAHNSCIEALLNVGLVGATILFLIAVYGWWRAFVRVRATDDCGYAFWFMFLTSCAISCLVESLVPMPGIFAFVITVGLVNLAAPSQQGDIHVANHSTHDGLQRNALSDRSRCLRTWSDRLGLENGHRR